MGATLGTIRTLQDQLLANSKTGNFDETERVQAINDSRLEVMEYCQWPQFKTYSDITFASGVGTLPTDFFYDCEDMYIANTDGTRNTIFTKISIEDFVKRISNTYTIQDVSGTEKLKMYAADDDDTLRFWYIKKPWSADLSSSSDTTGFIDRFDRVFARLSVAILCEQKNTDSNKANVFRYGNGNIDKPSYGSAYHLLSRLKTYYAKLYSPKSRVFKSYYDTHNFY